MQNKGIPIISKETNYWVVRPGVEGKFFDDFYYDNSIALGWDKIKCIEQVKKLKSVEPLKVIVKNEYSQELANNTSGEKGINRKVSDIANKIYRFINEIKIGDIIVTPGSKEILIGEVTGEAFLGENKYKDTFNTESEKIGELNKIRTVRWIKRINRDHIEPNLKLTLRVSHGICHVNNDQVITEINRCLYSFYAFEESGHTIYRIKSTEEIDFSKYANFIRHINGIYELLKDDFECQDLSIKTNVQSPGPIELIGECGLVKSVLAAANIIFKKNENTINELSLEQKLKIDKYMENNPNEYEYDDYEFPSIGGY